jgi:hypothetical protein
VLTAAHCVNYFSQEGDRPIESFTIETNAQTSRTFPVNAYASFGRETGASDLALMRLSEPVPAALATPRAIAASRPPNGTAATVFGYGCQSADRTNDQATGRKQKVSFVVAAEPTRHGCPGDSGGPTFRDDDGTIFIVTSAGDPNANWADIGADPVLNRAALNALADRWADGADALPEERDPNARDLNCNQILTCMTACQDDACFQSCRSRATGDGTLFYDALEACWTTAQCADWDCVEQQCGAQLTACRDDDSGGAGAPFPAPPEGAGTCNDLLGCHSGCNTDACRNECRREATAAASGQLDQLLTCIDQHQCQDSACMAQHCTPQYTACTGMAPPQQQPQGELSCTDLLDCAWRCQQDQACFAQCQARASAQASQAYSAYSNCFFNNNCQDDACAQRFCSAERAACLGPQADPPQADPPQQQPDPPPQEQPDPPPQQGQLSCNDLIACSWRCQDQACFAQCQAQASAEVNRAYSDYANCFFNNNCQDEACAQRFCSAEFAACTGRAPQGDPPPQQQPDPPPGGNQTCEGIYQCMQTCRDQACYDQCYARGSQGAQASYANLANCSVRNQCQDGNCIAARCGAEYQACFGQPPPQAQPPQNQPPQQGDPPQNGGGRSCPEVLDCFDRCPDQGCIQACFDAGSNAAQQQVNGIYECIDFFGCQDQACVQQNCQQAVAACR